MEALVHKGLNMIMKIMESVISCWRPEWGQVTRKQVNKQQIYASGTHTCTNAMTRKIASPGLICLGRDS